ncbi:MAG: hypothetical protein AAGA42_16975 [Actinomycetota bacterium]
MDQTPTNPHPSWQRRARRPAVAVGIVASLLAADSLAGNASADDFHDPAVLAGSSPPTAPPVDATGVAQVANESLAMKYGSEFLSGAYANAGGMTFDLVLGALGYDAESQLSAALADIGSSLELLETQVLALKSMMYELLDGQDRINFLNAYTEAGEQAARIDLELQRIAHWVEHDLDVSEAHVNEAHATLMDAVSQLAFVTVDPVAGTVPLMMKAVEPMNVTDFTDSYYQQIDDIRAYYRTVWAQALGALDMLRNWDTDGSFDLDFELVSERAADATLASYQYGIAPPRTGLDEDPTIVHVQDTDTILAAWGPGDPADGWSKTDRSSSAWAREWLQTGAENFRPELHGGITFEQYLRDQGLPTSFVYHDTWRNETARTMNGLTTRRYSCYARVDVGEVRGNSYHESTITPNTLDRCWYEDYNLFTNSWNVRDSNEKAENERRARDRRALMAHYARHETDDWFRYYGRGHSRIALRDATVNPGGWASNQDEQAVIAAAFPDLD